MKKMALTALLLALPVTATADESCGNFMAAKKTDNEARVLDSYKDGIRDLRGLEQPAVMKEFENADLGQKKAWVERAYSKCKRRGAGEDLANVITDIQ
ncbi:hypothetical protein C9J01_22745 [Photobacterium rosenbergii]|uniref:Uncharacterized protein n=1 Tax=Photobacterium rosenbergii TaxID=294936 RepID=A0A2T3N713_9GAMM|nr:hypothetical protein [Photobacterium rosenbergii]PSW08681.1 hypothetical protein C9J01_22745 [Photobacterium rosenbergii]